MRRLYVDPEAYDINELKDLKPGMLISKSSSSGIEFIDAKPNELARSGGLAFERKKPDETEGGTCD